MEEAVAKHSVEYYGQELSVSPSVLSKATELSRVAGVRLSHRRNLGAMSALASLPARNLIFVELAMTSLGAEVFPLDRGRSLCDCHADAYLRARMFYSRLLDIALVYDFHDMLGFFKATRVTRSVTSLMAKFRQRCSKAQLPSEKLVGAAAMYLVCKKKHMEIRKDAVSGFIGAEAPVFKQAVKLCLTLCSDLLPGSKALDTRVQELAQVDSACLREVSTLHRDNRLIVV